MFIYVLFIIRPIILLLILSFLIKNFVNTALKINLSEQNIAGSGCAYPTIFPPPSLRPVSMFLKFSFRFLSDNSIPITDLKFLMLVGPAFPVYWRN
jgi:hypothetical protein